MKKQLSVLIILTILFSAFTLGFFLGRNHCQNDVILSVPGSMQTTPVQITEETVSQTAPAETVHFPININTAQKEDFMALPGIGDILAQRILDYRAEHGDFSNPEDLMNVEGIGKKRMEEILDLITIGG